MIPYLAQLLDLTINNGIIPRNWKKATVIPIYKGGDHSVVNNYRPVRLTSVVSKWSRIVWADSNWLYEGQHGIRARYSYESHIITFSQDISDSLDERVRLDTIIIDSSKAFDLVPHDRLLKKIAASGIDSRISEFLIGRSQTEWGGGTQRRLE
jgi:hypothetical protein